MENFMNRTFKLNEIYLGDIVVVDDFVYVMMEKNENRPWLSGPAIHEKKDQLYVKEDDTHFVRIATGEVVPLLSYPCELGSVGLTSCIPLTKKFKHDIERLQIQDIELDLLQVIELENYFKNRTYHNAFDYLIEKYYGEEKE